MKAAMVFTTINKPDVLSAYYDNFKRYGHLDDVEVFIISDRKTPKEVVEICRSFRMKGMSVTLPSLEEQEAFLVKIGMPTKFIPYNSDNRRNIGYLMALASQADFLISIDDDNYARIDEDFFLEHAIVCRNGKSVQQTESSTNWFNLCELMVPDTDASVTYPRGFPYYARHIKTDYVDREALTDIHVNAGLWLGDPDVDGISWLVNPVRMKAATGRNVVLSDSTWTPINTQNTAMRREAVFAYYYFKMGYPFQGGQIDRYGDIFSGFFLEKCAHHLGGGVRVGSPCVDHKRNSHNYLKDANQEMGCVTISETLLSWLTSVCLSGSTYSEAYLSLSHMMEEAVEEFDALGWNDTVRGYFHQMAHYMRIWLKICNQFA